MSGPIVRSGPSKEYSENFEKIFGKKKKKKKAEEEETAKKGTKAKKRGRA